MAARRSRTTATSCEYTFDAKPSSTGIPSLLRRLSELGIGFKDLDTRQSSLEDIFVGLVATERRRGMTSDVPAFNRHGVLGHLPVRDGALRAHAAAEPGHAGDHDVALFRRVRRGDRRRA